MIDLETALLRLKHRLLYIQKLGNEDLLLKQVWHVIKEHATIYPEDIEVKDNYLKIGFCAISYDVSISTALNIIQEVLYEWNTPVHSTDGKQD